MYYYVFFSIADREVSGENTKTAYSGNGDAAVLYNCYSSSGVSVSHIPIAV